MLKTKVKVGKVTNLSDARYCAGMGVELLGFPIGLDQDSMDPGKYKDITEWISGPRFVLEWYGSQIPEGFMDIFQSYNAPAIEIDVRLLENIPSLVEPLLVRMDIDDWSSFRHILLSNQKRISYLLITRRDGAGVNPALIAEIGCEFPVLLGYGLSESTIDTLIKLPIAGISLEGMKESKPGLKDYSHLSEILERLEVLE